MAAQKRCLHLSEVRSLPEALLYLDVSLNRRLEDGFSLQKQLLLETGWGFLVRRLATCFDCCFLVLDERLESARFKVCSLHLDVNEVARLALPTLRSQVERALAARASAQVLSQVVVSLFELLDQVQVIRAYLPSAESIFRNIARLRLGRLQHEAVRFGLHLDRAASYFIDRTHHSCLH